jgi:predicted permease
MRAHSFWGCSVFELPTISNVTLVVMHSVPIAISMIVLSERYNFYKETIASTILISSLGPEYT